MSCSLVAARLRGVVARASVLGLAVVAVGPVAGAGAAVVPAGAGDAATEAAVVAAPRGGVEVPSLETARTRVWKRPNGSYVSRIFQQPVNVKDAGGSWTPINDTLVKTSSGAIEASDPGVANVVLPSSLADGPVRLSRDGDSVSLSLQGAGAGAAQLSGNTATYPAVAGGVTAKLSSTTSGVKEDLILDSAGAENTFNYTADLSAGLSLKARKDGGVDVVDGSGEAVFAIAAPLAYDANGALAPGDQSTLSVSGNLITVTLSKDWLSAPGRAFPVTLDPSANVPSAHDCYLDGSNTTTSYCTAAELWVGSSSGHDHRAIVNFGVTGQIPAEANIQEATVFLHPDAQTSPGVVKTLAAHALSAPFDDNATWVKRTASASWATPGGDFSSADLDTNTTPASGVQWQQWDVTTPATEWFNDPAAKNFGVELTDDGSSADNAILYQSFDSPSANDPYLQVSWWPRTAAPSDATILSQPISSSSTLGVNVAGGNLLLSSHDLHVDSTGLPVDIQRFYNSQDPWTGTLGAKGRLGIGNDMVLESISDTGDYELIRGDGARFRFAPNAAGGFDTPPGAGNVTLANAAGGRHTLTDDQSGVVYGFYNNPYAYMDTLTDADGNTLTLTYHGTNNTLSQITDSRGRNYTVGVSSSGATAGFITSITAPATTRGSITTTAQTWTYGYGGAGGDLLSTVTDPAGNVTHYYYTTDGSDLLNKITDANGHDTTIGYDSATQRVTSIKRSVDASGTKDATTTFSYKTSGFDSWCPTHFTGTGPTRTGGVTTGETTVYPPNYAANPSSFPPTYYCFDQGGQVIYAQDAKGNQTSKTFNPQGNSWTFGSFTGTSSGGSTGVTDNGTISWDTQRGENPMVATSPTNATTTYGYPNTGNDVTTSHPTSIKDSQGDTTTYSWSGPHVTGVKAYSSGTTGFGEQLFYTSYGSLDHVIDGNGNQTSYTYDPTTHELTTVTPQPLSPNGIAATHYTYDGLSRTATVTDGNGKVLTYGYDADNRVHTIADSDGKTTTITYDGDGNVTGRTEGTNTTTYTFDWMNRKTSESFPGSVTNTYAYDKDSNLTSLTDASGTATYTYDPLNRVSKITAPNGSGSSDDTSFAYTDPSGSGDATHSSVLETLPAGGTIKQLTDLSGHLTDTLVKNNAGSIVLHRGYGYTYTPTGGSATNGDLLDTAIDYGATASTPATTTTYGYLSTTGNNELGEAKTVNGTAGSNIRDDVYTYDNAGNRKTHVTTLTSGSPSTTTYAYNADNELCWQVAAVSSSNCSGTAPTGATTYTYDPNGNQTAGQASMTYDAKNRLKTLAGASLTTLSPNNFEITGIGTQTYVNNALGVGRTTVGGTLSQIVRDPGSSAAISQLSGSTKRWYVTDQLGSTIALIDNTTGNIARNYAYDPDGNVTDNGTGPDTQIRYAGGLDVGNGLYHYGARFYSPLQARWTQEDPLDQPDDLRNANRYVYAGDDPATSVDLEGTSTLGDLWTDEKCSFEPSNPNCELHKDGKGAKQQKLCARLTGIGFLDGPLGAVIAGSSCETVESSGE